MRQIAAARPVLLLAAFAFAGAMAASGQIYHAKIVVEGDTPTPSAPRVVAKLSNRLVSMCALNVFAGGTVEYQINWRSREYDMHDADSCPVTISLPGYRSMEATLRSGAVIVLKRTGDHEGSTVSMTSLNAPKDARKAFEKGQAAISESKWAVAQKNLENAVALYPEYAQAWCDLGETFRERSKSSEARSAWQHALQADPKYLKSYLQMARADLQEGRIDEALAITSKAMEQNPIEFPGIYFFNAVANYNLKHFDAAETSIRQAILHDSAREIPRAERLLASVLANRGAFKEATEHLNKYLELSPKAPDFAEVKQQIAELERRAAAIK